MYKIIIEPHNYDGALHVMQKGFVKDADDLEILDFQTKEEAQKWIGEAEEGAARPKYEIINDEDGIGPDCYDASSCLGEISSYGYRVNPEDIPEDILSALQIANFQYAGSSDDYDIYKEMIRGYTVVYCPKTIALELTPGLRWGKEAYYYLT